MTEAAEFEALLRQALAPVEPPRDLAARLEATLVNLTELAADELEQLELREMRDPRNWARPAAALVVGSTAGAALVVLRARRRQQRRRAQRQSPFELVERAAHDLAEEARRLLGPDGPRKR